MKLEEQVLSIEQARHLQEFGLDMSDAAHTWVSTFEYEFGIKPKIRWQISLSEQSNKCGIVKEIIPTYTLQELLSKFPPKYHDRVIAKLTNGVTVTYGEILEISRCTDADDKVFYGFHYGNNLFNGRSDKNPLQAAYKTLCWVLENGYLKEEKK